MTDLTKWLSEESEAYRKLTGDRFTRAEAIRANVGVALFIVLLLFASLLD